MENIQNAQTLLQHQGTGFARIVICRASLLRALRTARRMAKKNTKMMNPAPNATGPSKPIAFEEDFGLEKRSE
jgi:hypothetical protein